MKVYILNFHDIDDYPTTVGVFSSYSALLTWLDKTYGYVSKSLEDKYGGSFVNTLSLHGTQYSVCYLSYDVIGEHSHKTNTVSFKEV